MIGEQDRRQLADGIISKKKENHETGESESRRHPLCEQFFSSLDRIKDLAIRIEIENIVTEINRNLLDMEAEGVLYVRNLGDTDKPEVQTLCIALIIKTRHLLLGEEAMRYRGPLRGIIDHTNERILPFLHDTYHINIANSEPRFVEAAPTLGPHELLLAEFKWMDKIQDPVVRRGYVDPIVRDINELLKQVEKQLKKKKEKSKSVDLKEEELYTALGRLNNMVQRISSDRVGLGTTDRHYVELIQKNMAVLIPRYIARQKEKLGLTQ